MKIFGICRKHSMENIMNFIFEDYLLLLILLLIIISIVINIILIISVI